MNHHPDYALVKIEVYIPEEHVKSLAERLSEIGAGVIGNYDNCFAVTKVTGFWKPLQGSRPFLGRIGEVCSAAECKVEIVCPGSKIKEAIKKIREVHPYETPLIYLIPLLDESAF